LGCGGDECIYCDVESRVRSDGGVSMVEIKGVVLIVG